MSTGKAVTKFSYSSAKAKKFSLAEVRRIIDRLLSDPENGLYAEIEALMSEPGSTGRVSWDHCMAVQAILAADHESVAAPGMLNKMVEIGKLTMPVIGDQLVKQLRAANFVVERGRITAVVEDEVKPKLSAL